MGGRCIQTFTVVKVVARAASVTRVRFSERRRAAQCPALLVAHSEGPEGVLTMKRQYFMPALLALLLFGIVVMAGQPSVRRGDGGPSPVPSPTVTNEKRYSTDMKELRDRFNQDKGTVRLILLLSPT